MNYGLYLSATGVLTNSYRQDVIANNLANAETVGFKKDLALFQDRLTEAQQRSLGSGRTNTQLEPLGGGILVSPSVVDSTQGEIEPTGNDLDLAVQGCGYFAVDDHGQMRLTRDGRFMTDRQGYLVLASEQGQKVLNPKGNPIRLGLSSAASVGRDGTITQNGLPVNRVGLFDVPDPSLLAKQGGTLLSYPDTKKLRPATGIVRSGFVERANVDPATELASLMDAQRQLEANANMIRYQDQMLSKLVNEVGKIG